MSQYAEQIAAWLVLNVQDSNMPPELARLVSCYKRENAAGYKPKPSAPDPDVAALVAEHPGLMKPVPPKGRSRWARERAAELRAVT